MGAIGWMITIPITIKCQSFKLRRRLGALWDADGFLMRINSEAPATGIALPF
jgi:hypothetical protein